MDKTFPAIFAWLILKINILKEDCHLLYYPLVRNCDTDFLRHHDTQHNDIQHNDTQRKGLICETQHKRHSA